MDYEKFGIKRFNGKDFSLWKMKVINNLEFLGLNECLTAVPTKVEDDDKASVISQRNDNKAKAFVKGALCDNLFRRYTADTCKQLWDKILKDFEKIDAQQLFVLLQKFNDNIKSQTE